MGDFYQNGIVTNFHNLRNRSTEDLEQELISFSKKRPMTLVLPSLYSELEGNALPRIVDHLKDVPYLDEIVIGLDRADEEQFNKAREFFSVLPQHHRILWQDGPRLREIDGCLKKQRLAPTEEGKGRNAWYCYGYVLASGRAEAVAMHDCDILTYDRSMLARLFYPIANPLFNYEYCKGYYYRAADDQLHGRASRLLVTPLIRALKKIYGHSDYLCYLDSFRYPLSGEFSMRIDLLNDIRIPSDWGLEIGVLSEVKHNYETRRICQVDIADQYDHKHQTLSRGAAEEGLSKMSLDISKALFRKLATSGAVFNKGRFRTIKATYYRIALDFIETYYNDAVMNGMTLDRHAEEDAVEIFAATILKAGREFLDNPLETPFIPSWNRVASAEPSILEHIYDAVEKDNE